MSETADAATLLRAAQIIEHDGYTSGSEGMHFGNGPKCLLGAVAKAADIEAHHMPEREYAAYYMHEAAKLLPGSPEAFEVYRWSDGARFKDGFFGRRTSSRRGKKKVAEALRNMANGATFQEATA